MSCYMVSNTHINALITYGMLHRAWFRGNYFDGHEQGLAAMLYAANVESVNYRYNKEADTLGFKYEMVVITDALTPLDILSMCNCLEYQSCEHPGYDESGAYKLLIAIKDCAIIALPGYNSAIRDLNDEEVAP